MQKFTNGVLKLSSLTLLTTITASGVSGCGGKQVAIKPVELNVVAAAMEPQVVVAESVTAELGSHLVDPSPERLVLAARYGQSRGVKYFLEGGMAVDVKDAYGNTALIAAASNGQAEMVELLLARGAEINVSNKEELTALMGAAVKGHYELTHTLIGSGAEVNAMNNDAETALSMAVKYGHYKAAKVLLKGGANPNLPNSLPANVSNSGYTPLMYTATSGVTGQSVDWAAMAQLLIANGANPNLSSRHGDAALNLARSRNNVEVVAVLKKAGAKDDKVYAGLNLDETLLKAARLGDYIKVKQVLANGANPDFSDKNGVTPLLAAAHRGSSATLRMLLAANVEVNFVPSGLRQFALAKSHAPLNERELMEAASRGETALNAAVRQGHIEEAYFLLSNGASIGLANRHGETPLFVAVAAGNLDMVKMLLERGANPNSVEQDNRRNRLALAKHAMGKNSVLITAVQKGYLDVTKLLVEAGADVDYRGFMGKTAAYVAVENGRRKQLGYFLDKKANLNIISRAGISPLMEAAKLGNRHLVADLLSSAASVNTIERPELGYARETQGGGSSGMTALMFAARGGHDDVVDQLLQAGAETNIHNANGEDARAIASAAGYDDIVEMLSSDARQNSVTLSTIDN